MAIVRLCDLCNRIDREFTTSQEHCDRCSKKIEQITAIADSKAIEAVREEVSYVAANIMMFRRWMQHTLEAKPKEFRYLFGESGERFLNRILTESEIFEGEKLPQ